MDLSFGASSVSSTQAVSGAKDLATTQPNTSSSLSVPRSIELTAMLARAIFNSTFSPLVVRMVERSMVPTARNTSLDREERNRRKMLEKVKVSKSEAAGQQTHGRS